MTIWGFEDGITVPLGKAEIMVWRNNKKYKMTFQIVESNHMPLLSWESCEELGLITVCPETEEIKEIIEINQAGKPEALLKKYEKVFDGLGKLE